LIRRAEREAVFLAQFLEDLMYWVKTDRKAALRVLELVAAVVQDPFSGIGKPEPLKFEFAGCWSRRLTQEHRLVYEVSKVQVRFLQARYHY
jgi:toxin YoeB